MGDMGGDGINKLAQVIQARMSQLGERPQTLDFGVIQRDMSLLLNSFPKPVPQKDYVVCGAANIRPGDRVLAAWVGEDDLCVIDIIMPGSG